MEEDAGSVEDVVLKMEEILHIILSYTSIFDLKRAACVCRMWKDFIYTKINPDLLIVTVSGTNQLALVSTVIPSSSLSSSQNGDNGDSSTTTSAEIVQQFTVGAPRRKRKRVGSRQQQRLVGNSYCWPTCSIIGPNGQLYISQYKVMGVLEFNRSLEGFKYQRTLVSSPSFEYPEGLVVAYNSLYIVSVSNGTVSRVSLDRGDVIEQADCCVEDSVEEGWVLWGMCISPDQKSLFIAGHLHDERSLDYRMPTTENSGRVLRLNLNADGSFEKGNDGSTRGYFVENYPMAQIPLDDGEIVQSNEDSQIYHTLNRPTNPAFCRHGVLHVSSFITQSRSYERYIYKMICYGYPWTITDNSVNSIFLGWLQDDLGTGRQETTPGPWGIAFSKMSDECYVTCAKVNSQDPSSDSKNSCLLKLPTCGCHQGMFDALRTDEHLSLQQRVACYGEPQKFSTGQATSLVRSGIFDQPNYVTPI